MFIIPDSLHSPFRSVYLFALDMKNRNAIEIQFAGISPQPDKHLP